jgi:type IV secretory pathway TraG/TraD family ATPase VirD4
MTRNALPIRAPLGMIGAVVVTVLAVITTAFVQGSSLSPVELFYARTFVTSSLRSHLPGGSKPTSYTAMKVGGKLSDQSPCPADAQLVTAGFTGNRGSIGTCNLSIAPAQMSGWIGHYIYRDQTLSERFGFPFRIIAAVFPLLFIAGIFIDRTRRNRAKNGIQLRGPELVSTRQFNRRVKGDGLELRLANANGKPGGSIRIMRRHENNHMVTMADPGGGKTSIFFQLLDQVEARGETAIIYDPHMQFVSRYFDASRGDLIVNPLDVRCPSWNPSDEIDHSDYARAEANALAMANSLFPGKTSDRNWFFTYTSQLIWKHLLVEHQPDAHELAHLMQHSDPLIDMVVKDTELQQMLAQNAEAQRAGVISHLSQVAYALRQIPKKEDGRRHLVLKDWCKERRGWLFFTNTQDTRDGLRAIQSLMLDWLILCLLSQGERKDLPPVFAALDECQTLQKLGQLVALVTEGRKSLRVMYGMQGRSQIKNLYGDEAEVLLSSPYTKFLMRTSEPEASEWLSKTIGDVEIERVQESAPVVAGERGAHSYSTQRLVQRLVLPSEFAGLDDLNGYIRYGNLAIKVRMAIPKRRERAPKFLRREGVPLVKKPLPSLEELKVARRAGAARAKAEKNADEMARKAATIAAEGQQRPKPETETDEELQKLSFPVEAAE